MQDWSSTCVIARQVHEKIREDPEPEKKERSKPDEATRWKTPKLTYDERKAALKVRASFGLLR